MIISFQETVAGLNVPKVAKAVAKLVSECDDDVPLAKPAEEINVRCERLTKMAKCVVFIKGTPQVQLRICEYIRYFF